MIYPAAVLLASLQLGASSSSSNLAFVPHHCGGASKSKQSSRVQGTSSALSLSSTAFETAQGINTAVTNGEVFNNGFAGPVSPSLQNFLSPNGDNVADWDGLNEALSRNYQNQQQQRQQQQQQQPEPIGASFNNRNSNTANGSTNRRVMTGRERRAGWESYAAPGTPGRQLNASFGGVVGSPGGVGDWRFSTSYGPATTSASAASSDPARSYGASARSMPNTFQQNGNSFPNSVGQQQQIAKQHHVMTGAERRATFDSFSPFAPAHETARKRPAISGSSNPSQPAPTQTQQAPAQRAPIEQIPVKTEAESVAETLSALPTSYHGEVEPTFTITSPGFEKVMDEEQLYHDDDYNQQVNGGSAMMEDTQAAEEPIAVPMDTPARQSLPPYLSLQPIPGKGLGVITHKPFFKGEFIGNYEGEIMDEEVKDRRYLSSLQDTLTQEDREWIQSRLDRGQTLTGCYLYGVSLDDDDIYNRFNSRAPNKDESPPKRIYVDAEDEYKSLWTRFINHASPPNNNANPKSVPESYDGKPRVWFMANRDIDEGEEICFDYGDDYWLEGDEVY